MLLLREIERERELRATAAAESDGDAETVGQLTFELRVQLYYVKFWLQKYSQECHF